MGLLEVLHSVISLDIGFFIDLFFDNLFFFFAFYVLIHIFVEKKDTFFYVLILLIVLWAFEDIETFTGLTFLSASFLIVYYITKLAVVAFAESVPSLRKYTIIITTIQFYVAYVIFNFVLGGKL
ncbi:MAG TPA: hypothetical protein VFF13_06225 [archaeon]|nr:hypothetical protein [archaeon]